MQSHRLSLSLSPFVFQLLQRRAEVEGRTMASLAAFMVERDLRNASENATPMATPTA